MDLVHFDERSEGHFWPVFSDIAYSMLLLLLLFLVIQFLDYHKLFALEKIEQRQKEVASQIQSLFHEDEVKIIKLDELRQRLTFSADVLFPTCKAKVEDMTPKGRELIQKVGDILRASSRNGYFETIQIEGHTDVRPTSNTPGCPYPSNWELSSERATTVVRILETAGIQPELLSAIGRAEFQKPSNASDGLPLEEQYRQRRRIEMILLYTKKSFDTQDSN